MPDEPYRTPAKVASRERTEADENIAVHELALSPLAPLFWPRELRERIDTLRKDESDEAHIELAEKLSEGVDFVRVRQSELASLPTDFWSPTPNDDQWGPTGIDLPADELVQEVKELAGDVDANVEASRLGPRITARFTASGAPITWAIDLHSAGGGVIRMHAGTERIILTSSDLKMGLLLTDDSPLLRIRKESIVDGALRAVGIRSEAAIGDKEFDSEFWIEGNADFAKAMLTEPLRNALLALASKADFTFWLEGSVVELTWKGGLIAGMLTPNAFAPAVDALVAARRAFSRLLLFRS